MANVKDGSVTWSIESIYNAGQLNGLTAEQIKGQVVIPVTGVVALYGTFVAGATSSGGFSGASIPIPSGYDRNKCVFYCSGSWEYSNRGSFSTNITDVNNRKGVWNKGENGGGSGTVNIPYMLWSVK